MLVSGGIIHPDNIASDPTSYAMESYHSDAQFAGSSPVPAHVEMMGLIGTGNKHSDTGGISVASLSHMNNK